MAKSYRRAFVTQNTGHDFTALLQKCETIVFCSTGYEEEDELITALIRTTHDFNWQKDIVVPVGNVTANLLLGAVLARRTGSIMNSDFLVAYYRDKEYHIKRCVIGNDLSTTRSEDVND